jgi:hypothetical protein
MFAAGNRYLNSSFASISYQGIISYWLPVSEAYCYLRVRCCRLVQPWDYYRCLDTKSASKDVSEESSGEARLRTLKLMSDVQIVFSLEACKTTITPRGCPRRDTIYVQTRQYLRLCVHKPGASATAGRCSAVID